MEAVAAEEMMGTTLWWRNSAAVMGFSRCGWRLERKWGCCDLAREGDRWKGTAGMERVRLEEKGRDDGAGLRENGRGEALVGCVCWSAVGKRGREVATSAVAAAVGVTVAEEKIFVL